MAGVVEFTRLDVVVVPDVYTQAPAELVRVRGLACAGPVGLRPGRADTREHNAHNLDIGGFHR